MMKKLGIFAAGLLLVGAVSCTADYDCVCTYPLGNNASYDSTLATYTGVKKDDAETSCAGVQSGLNAIPGVEDVTCAATEK